MLSADHYEKYSFIARCGGCSESVILATNDKEKFDEAINSGRICGKCKQRKEEQEYRREQAEQDRREKRDRAEREAELQKEKLRLEAQKLANNQKQQKEFQQKSEKEKRERERLHKIEMEKQQTMHKEQIQLQKEQFKQMKRDKELDRAQLEKDRKEKERLHKIQIEKTEKQHKEQVKLQKEQMNEIRQQQKLSAEQHKEELKLQREQQNKLNQQMLKMMDDRKDQQKQFEQREKKIKQQLDKQISALQAQNIKDQTKYAEKLEKLNENNDKKLEKLEKIRQRDRKQYKKQMEDISKTNEENMKTLKHDELKNRLNQEIQLIHTRLQQYRDKKQLVVEIFNKYKEELIQISLEERRLNKYFGNEINDESIKNAVLLGITGHGKSTFACRLAGDTSAKCDSGVFKHSGRIYSETQYLEKKIVRNKWKKVISVIDTPGIFDSGGKDRFHTNNLVEFLKGCGGVNAFVVMKTRYPPRLDQEYQNVLRDLEGLFGKGFWKHVIFVLSHTKGADANPTAFKQYTDTFRTAVYNDLNLKEYEASLPFIGIDSFENWRKPTRKLIDIIPDSRFRCSELRSPLDELKVKNNNMKRKFDEMKQELNTIKQTILLSKNQIDAANKQLLQFDPKFRPKTVNLSLMNEKKDEWDINIVLPPEPEYKFEMKDVSDDEKIYTESTKPKFTTDEQKTTEPPKPEWVLDELIKHKYLAELDNDDEITITFQDDEYNKIPWTIVLNKMDKKYDEYLDKFQSAEEDGNDLYVIIAEKRFKNSLNEKQSKIQREIVSFSATE